MTTNIPSCEGTIICLTVPRLLGIWVVSNLWIAVLLKLPTVVWLKHQCRGNGYKKCSLSGATEGLVHVPLMAHVREKLLEEEGPERWASPALAPAAFCRKKCHVGDIRRGTTLSIQFLTTVITKISWSECFLVSGDRPHLQPPWIPEVERPARVAFHNLRDGKKSLGKAWDLPKAIQWVVK